MLPNAFVTLLTSPSYLPGALVLLHSLLDLHKDKDFKTVCLVTPETVDAKSIGELRKAGWDYVIGVEPIGSGNGGAKELALMGRPDLNLALTKLHLFRLHSLFSTLIYLDADVLPLRPLSHLFTSTNPHTLSACPDTGWPDCFNSGVMVIRPKESDWEGLRTLLKNGEGEDGIYQDGNGSFDGADQGLLNEWFSEEGGGGDWNRLSFTYNVTPTAAYTYAPAYKRFGHKINAVHFIGPNKPWSNLQGRPAGMSLTKKDDQAFDYPALIDRWYDVYDRHVRPSSAHEPNLKNRFAVPETVAVWNLATGVPVQPEDRLNLDQLKAATGTGVTSIKPGQYISLPLDGRVDLIMPRPKPKSPSPPRPSSPTAIESPEQIIAPLPQTLQQQTSQPATWDAQRYSPPKQGKPEMASGMDAYYAPAWEQAPSQQSKYFHQPQKAEPQYPTLPESVTGDNWYKDYHGKVPDRKNLKAVFPWESAGGQHRRPDRVFPKGDSPPPRPQPESTPIFTVQPASPPPREESPPPPPAPVHRSMADAMANYTNAWDSMPSIQRYISKITGKKEAPTSLGVRMPSAYDPASIQSVPPTPTEKKTRKRDISIDRRSSASGDGDDEDEASSEDEHGSPRMSLGDWKRLQPAPEPIYGNANYRDRTVQTEQARMNDAKVQAIPGGGPSPAVKTVDLPSSGADTPTPMSYSVARGQVKKERRLSRQSSSELPKGSTSPPDTQSPYARRVPFPVAQQSTGATRRPSWAQYQSDPRTHAKTREGVPVTSSAVGSGESDTQGNGGRYFDPATDVDVRKRDTQKVLTRFMKIGSFSQSGGVTGK